MKESTKSNDAALRVETKKTASSFLPQQLIVNSRFYIIAFSILFSFIVASYFRTAINGDTLYTIRIQQIYGFSALFFWYLALLATPLKTIFGKEGFMKSYLYNRRALGVSAAYFATLHMLLSLFGQLGGPSKLGLLPQRFQISIIFGGIALLFLLLMAATSFDKVISWMTFPRWKWLHRLGYIGAVLVFLHVWMISTHLSYVWIRQLLFALLSLLFALESWRVSILIERLSGEKSRGQQVMIAISLFVLAVLSMHIAPNFIDNNHSKHVNGQTEH